MELLSEVIIYLIAALIAVPISKRMGFGSVLGYLMAGIIIGPSLLGLIKDPDHILHFAELGVVFLLFVIGLELRPSRLWVLRKLVFGLGSSQVLGSALVIGIVAYMAGLELQAAIVVGLILALSSTSFVLQILAEKNELGTNHGRAAFAILLFQDLAVIPLIAILPLLGSSAQGSAPLIDIAIAITTIIALVVVGRFLLRPVLRIAAGTAIPEIFTATTLFVVIGAALLMQFAGLSMVLGAFMAGMLLADSEFRHELEADIAPFKGLLLGLFFIAVGMSVDLGLLMKQPAVIVMIVIALMLVKALVLFPIGRFFGICGKTEARNLAVLLAQGGEFAFVLFAIAGQVEILEQSIIDQLTLAVTVSLFLTPIASLINEWITTRFTPAVAPEYDAMDDQHNPVIIAGFGRVGQIGARLLAIVGKQFTALEIDSTQVDVVRAYGNVVHYGDASKLELLRAAGAQHAKIFFLAIDDIEASMRTAETITRHFPHLTIVARARNRRHEYHLMDLGIEHIYRETLYSSLEMAKQLLQDLEIPQSDIEMIIRTFTERDQQLIREQHAVQHNEEKVIQSANETARELELLLRNDKS